MNMVENKYCKESTLKLQLCNDYPECIDLVNCIIKQESYHMNEQRCNLKSIGFEDAKALNFDCVTAKQNPAPASVDMIVSLDNQKLLCIELKLNSNSRPPYKTKDLKDKKQSTSTLLSNETIQDFVVVFCHRNERAKRYLRQIENDENQKPKHGYKMLLLNQFQTEYF